MGACGSSSSDQRREGQYNAQTISGAGSLSVKNDIESRIKLHTSSILSVDVHDNLISTCSDDKTITISHLSSIISLKPFTPVQLKGHEKAVNKLAFVEKENNSRLLLWSASRDLSLRLWSLTNLAEDQPSVINSSIIKDAHSLNITTIGFPKISNDQESKLFSGSRDYSVKVWDVPTTKCINEYKMSRNIVTSIATSCAHPHTIFQSSEDLTVKLWDYRTPASLPSASVTGFVYFALTMDIHESGNYLATGCKGFNSVGCNVFIWDLRKIPNNINTINYLRSESPSQDYSGHSQDVTSCKFSKINSDYLYSVSKDGSIYAWEIKSASQRISYQFPKKYFTALVLLNSEEIQRAGIKAKESEEYIALSAMDGSLSILKFDFKSLQFDLVRTTLVALESEEITY